MNQNQISRIREDLLASNPELKGGLTDSVIEKAAEKVLSRDAQNSVEVKEINPTEPIDSKPKTTVSAESTVPVMPEQSSELPESKEIMNAVLEDLQGNGEKFTRENPGLRDAVDQVLKMPRNE